MCSCILATKQTVKNGKVTEVSFVKRKTQKWPEEPSGQSLLSPRLEESPMEI